MISLNNEFIQSIEKYPIPIQIQLKEIFATIFNNVDESLIKSIILIGSAARGELSYSHEENNIDIFSDYEFIIVTHKIIPPQISNNLKRSFNSLEKKWNIRSPLFSVDFGVASSKKWRFTPPTLWTFETKQKGLVVYGKDVRQDLVDINIENLDFGNLNQLILVRLWSMLIHVPLHCIFHNASEYEWFTGKFFLARNILDLLTIYLPNVGILESGYDRRLNSFIRIKNNLFDENELKFIVEAHNLKLRNIDKLDYSEAYFFFYSGYIKLLAFIAKVDMWDLSPSSLKDFIKKVEKTGIFKDGLIKKILRFKAEFYIFRKSPYIKNVLWLFKEKRYELVGAIISLHALLLDFYTNRQKNKFIEIAIYYLSIITIRDIKLKSRSVEESFIELRKLLLLFMMDWFYARKNVTEQDIVKIMEWKDN